VERERQDVVALGQLAEHGIRGGQELQPCEVNSLTTTRADSAAKDGAGQKDAAA
jgi:hypothetical protein